MAEDEFEATLNRLRAAIREAVGLLRGHGAAHWADWLERAEAQLARSDAHGLDVLLRMYGGMGSFNDLVLGGRCFTEEDRLANDRLDVLRREIADLARRVRALASL